MGPSDIRINVLLKTIEKMPDSFFTKDVSTHPDMLNEHIELVKHSHYHSFVGKALKIISDKQLYGILTEIQKGTKKGSLWQKSSLQYKLVSEISSDQARKINTIETPLIKPKWFFYVFIVVVLIIVLIVTFIIGLYFLAIIIMMPFIKIIMDVLKETKKGNY